MDANYSSIKLTSIIRIIVLLQAAKFSVCFGEGVKLIVMDNNYSNSEVRNDNDFGGGEHLNNLPKPSNEIISTDSIVPKPKLVLQNQTKEPKGCSQYFGMDFAPYVRTDGFPLDEYTMNNVKKMLKVILTKSGSISTPEMHYQHRNDNHGGPYNGTTASRIAPAAAEINLEADTRLISVSLGAGYSMWNNTRQPDFDAALYSANRANSIYPGTVWSINVDFTDLISANGNDTVKKMMTHVESYSKKTRDMYIQLCLYIFDCENILLLKDTRFSIHELRKLMKVTDFLICTIYPSKSESNVENYFNSVRSSFEFVKKQFVKYAPQTKLYLSTGWASQGWFVNNPPYMNSPQKTKQFWDLVEKWSEQTKQRVFMISAFDHFVHYDENGVAKDRYYNGYFKRADDNSDKYLVKGTNEIVDV